MAEGPGPASITGGVGGQQGQAVDERLVTDEGHRRVERTDQRRRPPLDPDRVEAADLQRAAFADAQLHSLELLLEKIVDDGVEVLRSGSGDGELGLRIPPR